MKKFLLLGVFILPLFLMLPASADVNDFYFSDFTGDYYLDKDEEGVSKLKVVERVTAVFPDFKQNKGICRQISFTNQDGANITLPNLTRDNIKVTRNGEIEPIYSIGKGDGYYDVCTGTDEYLMGEQEYKFEYEFENVVTEFEKDKRVYQELYWDTNGNGARQRFNKVTARLHFADKDVWTGDSWCYVGVYGSKDQSRCTITKTDDGVEFTANNLAKFENLTFDAELKAGSFVVLEPAYNYTYVWVVVILGALCVAWVIRCILKYNKTKGKAKYYKGIFVKPEYQPNKDYSLTEMAELYIGKKKDVKVAMLLELVVNKKIQFIKGEKKKWSIKIENLNNIGNEYIDLLSILNNGTKPSVGDTIELKSHTASSKLISLKKSMENTVLSDLKRDELVENKYTMGSTNSSSVSDNITKIIFTIVLVTFIGLYALRSELFNSIIGVGQAYGEKMVFDEYYYIVAIIMIDVTLTISMILSSMTDKYVNHTMLGLTASRYMDGLKLYIEMAEADRMKMLQSVKGADTSAEGIVKLYEKLLPYAAVFGLEKSWMEEMKEYCKVQEIEEPDYLMAGIAASEISRTLRSTAGYVSTSTVMHSSGGGFSSGFSGGGGGGFSGGGGGGGGFGGR